MRSLPSHIVGLLSYLSGPFEKANEDLALSYFRKVFGDVFTRQQDAKHADGYVPGKFVLELKGHTNTWLSGLLQGFAYRKFELDFGQIVVAAKNFLAVWNADDLPEKLWNDVVKTSGAPNLIGRELARKYAHAANEILSLAIWKGGFELSGDLFKSNPELVIESVESFERALKEGKRVRQRITLSNFAVVLKQMVTFFDPNQPIKAVRAFYSMLYGWDETSKLQISQKATDQAALGGEVVTNLLPAKREAFKDFVESHYISLREGEHRDDFFSRYDVALDSVDKEFRVKNGIFFTDLDLSKLVMWIVKQQIPELGKNYLVIDPACGSGNLVTNWRSPLELRHKVVSEIEPELLFAVEKRMKGDQWHHGRYTVIPKVSENKGLNFLDRSAAEYLDEIKKYLQEKGHEPNKPLAFLCNPPYRSDDDQSANSINYQVHKSILSIVGNDASNERYCCFLGQMKLICDVAKSSGLPGDSLLLLFTKSAWLTKRSIFADIRAQMLSVFEDVTGILIDGSEFFDVKGRWPVVFSVWRYKGAEANLDPHRGIPLLDLTWLKKEELMRVPWNHSEEMERTCREILRQENAKTVDIGRDRNSIRRWSGKSMVDFKRSRRKAERDRRLVGGLPRGDRRLNNRKAYGESLGKYIGFMDDLTPCRIKQSTPEKPWFRLNSQFMDAKKNRCFSGPPTHWGYCATELESTKKLFLWYALARTFVQEPYPMWADAEDMWEPDVPARLERKVLQAAFAIAYAENDCIEARFPADNPVKGAPELELGNPMTPLSTDSFWSKTIQPYCNQNAEADISALIKATDQVFATWKDLFKNNSVVFVSDAPYVLDSQGLTAFAGLPQIKDYAVENNHRVLLECISHMQTKLREVKKRFFNLVNAKDGLDYFGSKAILRKFAIPTKTKFERILAKRLAVSGILVDALSTDPHFGRTKLTKLFYLADAHIGLDLEATYYREAAGPLDQRALYHERIGLESLARKFDVFTPVKKGVMFHYVPGTNLSRVVDLSGEHIGHKSDAVRKLANLFLELDTEQSEIVATLYACWNDLLIAKQAPTENQIIDEFVTHWHPRKARFPKRRLSKALAWMRDNHLIPTGMGKTTKTKPAGPE